MLRQMQQLKNVKKSVEYDIVTKKRNKSLKFKDFIDDNAMSEDLLQMLEKTQSLLKRFQTTHELTNYAIR